MEKRYCMMYDVLKDKCKGLDDLYCDKEECRFYKTKQTYLEQLAKIQNKEK